MLSTEQAGLPVLLLLVVLSTVLSLECFVDDFVRSGSKPKITQLCEAKVVSCQKKLFYERGYASYSCGHMNAHVGCVSRTLPVAPDHRVKKETPVLVCDCVGKDLCNAAGAADTWWVWQPVVVALMGWLGQLESLSLL